jgi:prepilin-type N-terminal cleavage/methylation domain-containing protein
MKRPQGFTLVEVMIVVAIVVLLAGIAIPNILRGRTTANESAAISNFRVLVSALEMYRSVNAAYPWSGTGWQTSMYGTDCLTATVPNPDFGPPSFCNAMSASPVQGYLYTYTGQAAGTTYTLQATPSVVDNTGTRSFFANETGLIRHCTTAVQGAQATATDPTIDVAGQPPNC